MRIFICSTCYDLIDVRSEVETFFAQAGVIPILSDSLISEFQVATDANSIQTCLANVRACDEFVIILSNRYGPRLEKAGFGDISATHLEYREAKRCGKPIHMYVRDHLEGDYATWKLNTERDRLHLPWCKERKDWKIFELLEEHRNLVDAEARNNWLWPFRSSMELKQRLGIDFKDVFVRMLTKRLFENGRVPFLDVSGQIRSHDGHRCHIELTVRNLSQAVALRPRLQLNGPENVWTVHSLGPLEQMLLNVGWGRWAGYELTLPSCLFYSVLEGHQFEDHGKLTIFLDPQKPQTAFVRYAVETRKCIGSMPEMQIQ